MSRESKLVELRRKTDRDLIVLARRELDLGMRLADAAMVKLSPPHARAERAYAMAKLWLPLISGPNREERKELEFQLKELRAALDRLPSEVLLRRFAGAE